MKHKLHLVSIFRLNMQVTIGPVNIFILAKEKQTDLIVFRVL